jgi:hypothetical protein
MPDGQWLLPGPGLITAPGFAVGEWNLWPLVPEPVSAMSAGFAR